jgi:hypothetical protein
MWWMTRTVQDNRDSVSSSIPRSALKAGSVSILLLTPHLKVFGIGQIFKNSLTGCLWAAEKAEAILIRKENRTAK